MITRRAALACAPPLLVAGLASKSLGIDEFGDLKTIRSLPQSSRDIERAHARSRGERCETLPEGLPLELSSFATILTDRDRREAQKRRLIPASRHNLFTVGLKIAPQDRREMPVLSRGAIVDYLDSNYVAIQARVRRDLLDRELYYHHRPIALTAKYRSSNLTRKFEPVVAETIHEFHSLGLYTQRTAALRPADLRTIVLVFKYKVQLSSRRAEDRFEFVFIRGVTSDDKNRLDSHIFVTNENRTQLKYLPPFTNPLSQRNCGIQGNVVITRFDSSGIYPRESATRSYLINSRSAYSMGKIDDYCRSKGLLGGIDRNLDTVLDAIIEGDLVESEAS